MTDEKASAAHALGLYAEFCGTALVPHFESMLSALSVSVEYFHEGVRECGYASLGHLCIAAHSAAETGVCLLTRDFTSHVSQRPLTSDFASIGVRPSVPMTCTGKNAVVQNPASQSN